MKAHVSPARLPRAVFWVFAALLLAACGSRSSNNPAVDELDASMPECDQYIATLATCAARAGQDPAAGDAQREALRARFVAAASDGPSRTSVRAQCASGRDQLASCGH